MSMKYKAVISELSFSPMFQSEEERYKFIAEQEGSSKFFLEADDDEQARLIAYGLFFSHDWCMDDSMSSCILDI